MCTSISKISPVWASSKDPLVRFRPRSHAYMFCRRSRRFVDKHFGSYFRNGFVGMQFPLRETTRWDSLMSSSVCSSSAQGRWSESTIRRAGVEAEFESAGTQAPHWTRAVSREVGLLSVRTLLVLAAHSGLIVAWFPSFLPLVGVGVGAASVLTPLSGEYRSYVHLDPGMKTAAACGRLPPGDTPGFKADLRPGPLSLWLL